MSASNQSSVICPTCHSEYVIQVHRLRVEKWVTSKYKYRCTDCGKQFFLLKAESTSLNQNAREHGEEYFHFYRS